MRVVAPAAISLLLVYALIQVNQGDYEASVMALVAALVVSALTSDRDKNSPFR